MYNKQRPLSRHTEAPNASGLPVHSILFAAFTSALAPDPTADRARDAPAGLGLGALDAAAGAELLCLCPGKGGQNMSEPCRTNGWAVPVQRSRLEEADRLAHAASGTRFVALLHHVTSTTSPSDAVFRAFFFHLQGADVADVGHTGLKREVSADGEARPVNVCPTPPKTRLR